MGCHFSEFSVTTLNRRWILFSKALIGLVLIFTFTSINDATPLNSTTNTKIHLEKSMPKDLTSSSNDTIIQERTSWFHIPKLSGFRPKKLVKKSTKKLGLFGKWITKRQPIHVHVSKPQTRPSTTPYNQPRVRYYESRQQRPSSTHSTDYSMYGTDSDNSDSETDFESDDETAVDTETNHENFKVYSDEVCGYDNQNPKDTLECKRQCITFKDAYDGRCTDQYTKDDENRRTVMKQCKCSNSDYNFYLNDPLDRF